MNRGLGDRPPRPGCRSGSLRGNSYLTKPFLPRRTNLIAAWRGRLAHLAQSPASHKPCSAGSLTTPSSHPSIPQTQEAGRAPENRSHGRNTIREQGAPERSHLRLAPGWQTDPQAFPVTPTPRVPAFRHPPHQDLRRAPNQQKTMGVGWGWDGKAGAPALP